MANIISNGARENNAAIEVESFVTQLYRHLLLRDPDPDGLASHSKYLRHRSSDEIIGQLISSMATGPEGASKLLGRMLIGKLKSLQDLKQPPISEVVSLGSHCYTAQFLERFGLRHSSWPFDWIFSSPGMVAHCINDRFKTFLDKSYYDSIPLTRRGPNGEGCCDHRFYKEKFGVNRMFNHHDPLNDADYDMYLRRVQRFLSLLESEDRKLFLLVVRRYDQAQYEAVAKALLDASRNFELVYVAVEQPDEKRLVAQADITTPRLSDAVMRLRPVSPLGDLSFDDWTDELPIVKHLFKKNLSQPLAMKSKLVGSYT